jgi:hypothetical protein
LTFSSIVLNQLDHYLEKYLIRTIEQSLGPSI